MQGGKFRIAGGKRGSKVSWQVTGVRNDAWAQANHVPVEEEKRDEERGIISIPASLANQKTRTFWQYNNPDISRY
jgi:hypothetical protein